MIPPIGETYPRMSGNRVLVTGFEPFGDDRINPSELIVKHLNGCEIAGATIIGRVLPCVFGESSRELRRLIDEMDPSAVLCLGQAGGREGITLERVALNVDDARLADNAGGRPIDAAVIEGGPVGYWSTLPIKAMVASLVEQGLPASVSQTAGTYVCNHVFYSLMHHVMTRNGGPRIRAGFIHVPWLPEQVKTRPGQSALPLDAQLRAIRSLIETALTSDERRLEGGAEH